VLALFELSLLRAVAVDFVGEVLATVDREQRGRLCEKALANNPPIG
jgi:hypothetical protein